MSDAWFEWEIAPDGVAEDGCHPDEAQALKDYLRKKTTAKEAARAITRPIEESEEDPHENLYRLWGLLSDALIEVSASEWQALIDLLDEIQKLPEPNLTGRKRAANKVSLDGPVWRELPGFGHDWADTHKPAHWRDAVAKSDLADRSKLRTEHVKKAEIEARLALAGVGGIPLLDWGYECIADALECRNAVLDFEIPAAARWIALAGERLYAGAVDGEKSWALRSRRDFGKEDEKMSLERWAFWIDRLEEVLKQSEDEATRDAAKAAICDMEALMAKVQGSK